MATNHQTESTAMQIGEVAKRSFLTVDAIRSAVAQSAVEILAIQNLYLY